MALLVGELYARVTAPTSDARAELDRFDAKARDVANHVDINWSRMAKRAAVALGGIGIAGLAAGTATGAALAGVPMLFMGITAAALASKAEVADAWGGLGEHITSSVRADADHLASYYIESANRIGRSFDTTMRPMISRAMAASAPQVLTLTDGVLKLAENALPGMVTAVERADAPMAGFASMLARTGTATSGFLIELTKADKEAGQSLDHFGALAEGVLPPVGTLLADLTRVWGEHGDEVVAVISKLVSGVVRLTGGVLPTLGDGLGLAADATGGLLDILGMLIGGFTDLPGPIQAGVAAMVAWRLVQSRVMDGATGIADRARTSWRGFGDEIRVQQQLMAMSERTTAQAGATYGTLADRINQTTGVSRGLAAATQQQAAAMDVVRSRIPVLNDMLNGYERAHGAVTRYAEASTRGASASDSLGASVKNAALTGLAPFTASAAGAAAVVGTGLRSAVSGLVGVLGGPWGVAIIAAVTLIGMWMSKSQEAAARQERLATAGREVAEMIAKQNGAIDSNIRKTAADKLEKEGLLKTAQSMKIPLSTLNAAYLGNSDALEQVRAKTREAIEAARIFATDEFGNSNWTGQLTETGRAAQQFGTDFETARTKVEGGADSMKRVEDAAREAGTAIAGQRPPTTALGDAFLTMSKGAGNAEDRIKSLKDVLDDLADDKYTLEEATQAINDSMRELGQAVKDARGEATKTAPWIDAAGAINTATAAGSGLQDKMMTLGEAHRGQFAAVMENARAHQKTLPEAMVEAVRASEATRLKLIDTARAAGASREEAVKLADRYAALPPGIATQITQPGMTQSILDAIGLKGKYHDVPGYKWTTISSSSPEQIRLLEILGYRVEHLPNGAFRVTANTGSAQAVVDDFVRDNNGRLVTIRVVTNTGSAHMPIGGGAKYQATGQIMEYYATGGIRMTPMSAASAAIVGSYRRTGVVRGIGDNATYDEGYIPIDPQSARSQAILSEVIRRMRPDLWQMMTRGVMPMADGGLWAAGNGVPTQRGGRSFNVGGITINTPNKVTARELRDALYEYEVLYA